MLTKFAVTNYRGFKERIELDLSDPNGYEYNSFAIKNGVVKDLMIYGPNGAGKSNLGFALFDIVSHLTTKNKQPQLYSNFSYAGNGLPVSFEYTFVFDGKELFYEYSKTIGGILLTEKLTNDGTLLFDRQAEHIQVNESLFSLQQSVKDNLLRQANNVSIVSYLVNVFPMSKDNPLVLMSEFVDNMLWFRCLQDRGYIGFEVGTTNLEEYIIEHGLLDDFGKFVLSVSGQQFTFAKPQRGEKVIFCLIDGRRIALSSIESTGTSSLTLLYYWLSKLSEASFVFIDEFDAFYHYELAFAVCKRLFAQSCQVILTTHNTSLMTNDLLRPDCYYLIDGKQVKPLNKCTSKELRLGHNLEKLYRGDGFVL
jgi:AAA15 family ATPase/GTPase